MKKSIAMFVVFGLMCQLALPVKRADALIGLIVYSAKNHHVGVPLMIAGGVGILPGAPVVGLIAAAAFTPADAGGLAVASAGLVGVGAGILTALVGILVLDSPAAQQDLAFAPVSESEANALGLSAAERIAYERELPEINALRETVREKVMSSANPSFKLTSQVWESYSQLLDPQAFEALKKVSAGIRKAVGG